MAVTPHPPENPTCWRVYRAWDRRRVVHQHYIPFGRNREKAKREALKLDESLAERQRAHELRKQLTGDCWMNTDGSIVGLQRRTRVRGASATDLLIVQISVASLSKQIKKEFSIPAMGFEHAFQAAITFIADARGIDRRSLAFQRMQAAESFYLLKMDAMPPPATTSQEPGIQSDLAALERALQHSAQDFVDKRSRGVVRNRY